MKKIRILGNCQVGGIADTISHLIKGVEVKGEIAPSDSPTLSAVLGEHLESQGFLILSDSVKSLIMANQSLADFDLPQNVYYPSISFAAFHPDIQYAFAEGKIVKNGLGSDWNSRILLWAYLNGLSPSRAQDLFHDDTFEALGYFNEWNRSNEDLRKAFMESGFDYSRWIRSVKRTGAFMYGINHPTQMAISELAAQLAEKLIQHSKIERINQNSLTTDYLSHIVWPIYPEIGDHLGLEGSYYWRVSKRILDLNSFTEACYRTFDNYDLCNRKISFIPSLTSKEDEILNARSKI